jgi:hypothetical protein
LELRERYEQRREAYREVIAHGLRDFGKLHLLRGLAGNLGDALIWDGTDELLASKAIIAAPFSRWDIDGRTRIPGTLVVPGNGACTQSFHDWLPDLVIQAASMFDHVVLLPCEIDGSVPVVAKMLALPNLAVFARDLRSYRSAASSAPTILAPDVAVFAPQFQQPQWTNGPRADARTLVALRTDVASALGGEHAPGAMNRDVSMVLNSQAALLAAIDEHDEVVTDRLHVAIASTLRGRYVWWFDGEREKIRATLPVALGGAYGCAHERVALDWLLERGYVT